MPTYTYRCRECPATTAVWVRVMRVPPPPACGECGRSETYHAPALQNPQINTHCPLINCEYMSALARYPGDPEAHVSGPHSRQRLIDKRKREGWIVETKARFADGYDGVGLDPKDEKKDARKERFERKEKPKMMEALHKALGD